RPCDLLARDPYPAASTCPEGNSENLDLLVVGAPGLPAAAAPVLRAVDWPRVSVPARLALVVVASLPMVLIAAIHLEAPRSACVESICRPRSLCQGRHHKGQNKCAARARSPARWAWRTHQTHRDQRPDRQQLIDEIGDASAAPAKYESNQKTKKLPDYADPPSWRNSATALRRSAPTPFCL